MTGIAENRMVGSEYTGIKQIPELQHDKDGKEYGFLREKFRTGSNRPHAKIFIRIR